jgi:hypothetical protein
LRVSHQFAYPIGPMKFLPVTPWIPKSRGCYHVLVVHHLSHIFFCNGLSRCSWSASCPSPSIAKTRLPKRSKKDSQRIQQYVWSFAYRWSHKADLKGSLAKLAAKVNKRRRRTHEERKRRGRNAVLHSVFQIHICKLFGPIEFNDMINE